MPLIGANTKTPALYVLAGAGSVAMTNLANAQSLTGMTFSCLEVFNTNLATWADWESPWFASDPSQGYTSWVAADPGNRQLIVSYNMIPTSAGSMTDPLTWETNGANGAFNTHAANLATNLVAAGLGYSVIRLGLEANGNWNIDSIGGSTPGGGTVQMRSLWAQTFAQEVTAMRAVAGAHFTFCWCPNAVVAGVPFADYYPGNAYVDVIGIDAYDAFANGSQPAASATATANLFAQAYGLNDLTAFAVAQGKPLGLGEWGTQLGGADGGLGDDQYYVQGIANWVATQNVAFHCYFDSGSDAIIPLSSSYPLTLAAYSSAFASGGPPVVVTGAASGVTSSAATLNGTVNPKGAAATWQFEYGPTTGYGTLSPGSPGSAGSGTADVAESASLTGLLANTVYHYRLNAVNASGTTHGLDGQFTTAAAGGGGVTRGAFSVSASVSNFNDGGALKVFVATGVTAAGGAHAASQAFDPGPANVTLIPAVTGSLPVFGAFIRAVATLTAAANNTLSDSGGIAGLYSYADGRYTGTVTSGAAETAGLSTSVANWNDIVAYELVKSGTPAIDATTPAAVTGTASPMTVPSFTPTTSAAVLAAVVMCSTTGTTASTITVTDTSGLGLTWTQRAIVPQTGFSFAGVAAIYTADLPAAAVSGAPATKVTITPSAAGAAAGAGAPSAKVTITPSAAGVSGGASGTGSTTAGVTITPSAAGLPGVTGPPVFPGTGSSSLGFKAELLLGGTWTDVTGYVLLRDQVNITGMGRADWTSTLQAAQLTLTLRNDGRFSPKNSAGAYYPNIVRNCQVRVSVQSQSVTGVVYSGYRFWGEIAEWPPRWDVSGRDVHTDITANGIWRRMSQLQTTLGSAYTRYNSVTLTGSSAPRCGWPMEDGTGSGQLVAFGSVAGTGNAAQSFVTGQAGLSLAACTDFKGSDGIPQLNAAMITATVPAGGTATNNVTRFLLSVPAAGDSASGTTNWNLAEIASAGTAAKFEVYLNYGGTLTMQLRNSGGTVIAAGTTTTSVKGQPYLVSCELTPSGGNVAFALRIIKPGAAGITESVTGTLTTASVAAVSTVKFNRAFTLMDTAVGGLTVTYGAVPSMVAAARALGGYTGEFALDRFTRICGEMGIPAQVIGTNTTSAPMGPQVDDTLTNVLQSIEDTDCGLLFESRNQFGLGYRTLASMANQAAAVTLNYAGAILDPSLAPAYDDQLTRNYIQVTNWTGYTQGAVLTAGAMSVLNPPSGIGNGYNYQRAVNAAADSQLPGIANWLLGVGAADEIRFPVVTVEMGRAQAAPLFAALPGLRPGDYLQITNMPAWMPSGTVKQLAWGYSETITAKRWTLSINAVPESPYETGFSPGTVQLAQLPGGSPVTSTAPGAGGLGGIIANGSITPGMLSQGITVKTLGGNRITISVTAPASPDTNDIWIASTTGLISQWNGATWSAFKLDASQTIQAGTIVAANIASSTLTSSLIAAGQVYAGFVDATSVRALEYIATSTQGEFLAYDTDPPSAGHLINAVAGSSGTDSYTNPYPKGLYSQQLTLLNQGSGPPAFSGASIFYSSTAGRPRYKNSAGDDSVIERSTMNLTNVTVGNTTTHSSISSAMTYQGSEGAQSSEYEIEIRGQVNWATAGTAQTLSFAMYDGATNIGGQFTVGAASWPLSEVIDYTVRFNTWITGGGGAGTGLTGSVGWFADASGNRQPSNSVTGGSQDTASYSIDWTINHTFTVKAWWGATQTGQTLTTYSTKLTRRN